MKILLLCLALISQVALAGHELANNDPVYKADPQQLEVARSLLSPAAQAKVDKLNDLLETGSVSHVEVKTKMDYVEVLASGMSLRGGDMAQGSNGLSVTHVVNGPLQAQIVKNPRTTASERRDLDILGASLTSRQTRTEVLAFAKSLQRLDMVSVSQAEDLDEVRVSGFNGSCEASLAISHSFERNPMGFGMVARFTAKLETCD